MLLVLEIGTLYASLAEGSLDGQRLDRVVHGGAGAVGVDIVDVGRIEPRAGQGLLHAGDRAAALVVAVGDPEGVGRRAVADDLAVDPRPRALACSSSSSTSMPAPSPRMKPSRSRSKGRLARVGSSLRVDSAVRRMKPVTPNGWIMLCVPPERITSALPRRISSNASPIACELAAQAVRQLALGPRAPKRLARWPDGRPRLLLGLADRVQLLDPHPGELGRVHVAVAGRLLDQPDEPREVLLPLPRAEVDAEPPPVERPAGLRQPRVLHGHRARRPGRTWCCASAPPTGRRRAGSRPGGSRGPPRRSAWGTSGRRTARSARRRSVPSRAPTRWIPGRGPPG